MNLNRRMGVCVALWMSVSPAVWALEPLDSAGLPEAPEPQGQAAPQPQALQIAILDGEGALNNIRQRTAREPIVQVQDRNRKPVAGVLILFAVNDGPSGAGATIGGSSTFSALTDADGRAVAHGFTPNGTEGKYTIAVTATLGALVATAIIHQENKLLPIGQSSTNSQQSTQSSSSGANSTAGNAGAAPDIAAAGSHASGHIAKSTVVKGLIAGGVVAGVVVAVLALTGSGGSSITAGAGAVGHP